MANKALLKSIVQNHAIQWSYDTTGKKLERKSAVSAYINSFSSEEEAELAIFEVLEKARPSTSEKAAYIQHVLKKYQNSSLFQKLFYKLIFRSKQSRNLESKVEQTTSLPASREILDDSSNQCLSGGSQNIESIDAESEDALSPMIPISRKNVKNSRRMSADDISLVDPYEQDEVIQRLDQLLLQTKST